MAGSVKRPVSAWVVSLSIIAIAILAVVDMLNEEAVPVIVYGILGGIALGADGDIFSGLFGGKK